MHGAPRTSQRRRLNRKERLSGLLMFLAMLLAIIYGIYLGIWLLEKERKENAPGSGGAQQSPAVGQAPSPSAGNSLEQGDHEYAAGSKSSKLRAKS